jgi:hypothetical protein
MDMGMRN